MSKIILVENTSEIGAGTRGASLGPEALKVVARTRNTGYFANYETIKVPNQNDVLSTKTEFQFAKRIDSLYKVYEATASAVSKTLANNDFPLILAGDHASAGGSIAGIKMAYPEKRLGVIWIDAHADLHTPYTTPSGNIHGMPLATAIATDNLDSKVNKPADETIEYWSKLKNLGGIAPKIKPEDLIFIGVRDTEKPEDDLMASKGIKNFTVAEVRSKGISIVLEEIQTKLSECDMVYISFDVDSMDCEIVSRGTGTPVENGLTPEEAEEFLNHFASWNKTVCMEIVEINPCLDNKINLMAETAYDLLEKFTPKIESRL